MAKCDEYEEISIDWLFLIQQQTLLGNTTINVDEGSDFNVGDIIAFSTTVITNDFDDGDFYRITLLFQAKLTFVQHKGSGD